MVYTKNMNKKLLNRAERVLKGAANKNRIRILGYIENENETSVWAISQQLNIDFANASQHLARLEKAGLINKHNLKRYVYHELTPYGQKILDLIESL